MSMNVGCVVHDGMVVLHQGETKLESLTRTHSRTLALRWSPPQIQYFTPDPK